MTAMKSAIHDIVATSFSFRSQHWRVKYKTQWLDENVVDTITDIVSPYISLVDRDKAVDVLIAAFEVEHSRRWGSCAKS